MNYDHAFLEGLCGGLLVEGYVLVGPSYSFAHSSTDGTTSTGHTGLIRTGIAPATIVSLTILAGLVLLIGVTAVIDSRGSKLPIFRVLLLTATVLLIMYACVGIASIGVLLIPSIVLALSAAVLAVSSERPRRRQQRA